MIHGNEQSPLSPEPIRLTIVYFRIYPSTYEVRVLVILPKHVLVHILGENDNQFR